MPAQVPHGRRDEIWKLVNASLEPLSIADIAAQLDVHPNTVRFHVETLVARGQLERAEAPRNGPGRPPLMFRGVRRMDPGGPRRWALLGEVLVDALSGVADASDRARKAGRSWWNRHGPGIDETLGPSPEEPRRRLHALLDELGFAPESGPANEAADAPLRLRHCPFLELTAESSTPRTDIVCPVHLGLMRGALESWDADITVELLDPLVEPDLCVAHVGEATSDAGRPPPPLG